MKLETVISFISGEQPAYLTSETSDINMFFCIMIALLLAIASIALFIIYKKAKSASKPKFLNVKFILTIGLVFTVSTSGLALSVLTNNTQQSYAVGQLSSNTSLEFDDYAEDDVDVTQNITIDSKSADKAYERDCIFFNNTQFPYKVSEATLECSSSKLSNCSLDIYSGLDLIGTITPGVKTALYKPLELNANCQTTVKLSININSPSDLIDIDTNTMHISWYVEDVLTDYQKSISSIKKIADADESHKDGCVYFMDIYGDYAFDKFIAQGGAKNDLELISFVQENVTQGVPIFPINDAVGCSSFTAPTTSGQRLFSRNFDLSKSNTCIARTNPGGGHYKSLMQADLKFCGISQSSTELSEDDKYRMLCLPYINMDGINSEGLACSIYMTRQGTEDTEHNPEGKFVPTNVNTDKPDITSTTLLRQILDNAKNVDEAVAIASGFDMHDSYNSNFHYCVCDSTGKAAYMCWAYGTNKTDGTGDNRTFRVIYSDGTNPLVVTNFCLLKDYYDNDTPKAGLDRYNEINNQLQSRSGLVADVLDAAEILKIVGVRQKHTTAVTLYSTCYNLSQKTEMICFNEHFDNKAYYHYIGLRR